MIEKGEKKHFVLVHGFCHGAWCWYKIVSMLKLSGHRVSALDLGGCGVHQIEVLSMADYLQPLMSFMADLPDDDEKVILVGHSYGGIPISLAMESFPNKISVAVFVTAYMPNCTDPPATLIQQFFKRSSTKSFMDCEFKFNPGMENIPISALFGPDFMANIVYKHCSLEDLELGKMLIRPNMFFCDELSKKSLLSKDRYGSIKRCYVVCEQDDVMDEEFQRYIIEKSPPHNVVTIPGSAHMPMLTKPHELYSCLLELAQKYC